MTPSVSVLDILSDVGVIPVVELESIADAAPLVEALAAGGCRVAEITLRTDAALCARADHLA